MDNGEKIFQKLEEHSKRFDSIDARFDAHDKRFDAHDKRFDAHDEQFERMMLKLVSHDERISHVEQNMATKEDMREIKDTLESIVTIVKKIQEDHVFAIEWLKRLQDRVDRQDEEIRQIKLKLQIA